MLCVWIPSTFIGAINVPVTQKISNETGTQCDMLSAIGNVVVGSDCFRIGGFRMRAKLNPDFIIPCCIIFMAYIRLGFFISSMKLRQVIVFIFIRLLNEARSEERRARKDYLGTCSSRW